MIEMHTGRPATLAPRGMVACPHALASQAGVEILKARGSAVDAAIAASAALSVIYPQMTGLGGDAFWLMYDAKQNRVRWLSGRFVLGEPRDLLNIEGRYPEGTLKELERRGHVVNRWAAWNHRRDKPSGIAVASA